MRRIATFKEYEFEFDPSELRVGWGMRVLLWFRLQLAENERKTLYINGRSRFEKSYTVNFYKYTKHKRFTCLCPVSFPLEIGKKE